MIILDILCIIVNFYFKENNLKYFVDFDWFKVFFLNCIWKKELGEEN